MRTRFHRFASAAIMAAGVTLLAAGLLSYTGPPALGDPARTPGAPTAVVDEVAEASPSPSATRSARPSPSPSGTSSPGPTRPARPTPAPEPAVASRVVVPSLDIDLPVVPGNPGYPLCDVAQWLAYYGQPGEPRTVYLYAHAR